MECISLKIYTALKVKGGRELVKSVWGLAESNVFGNEAQLWETGFSYYLSSPPIFLEFKVLKGERPWKSSLSFNIQERRGPGGLAIMWCSTNKQWQTLAVPEDLSRDNLSHSPSLLHLQVTQPGAFQDHGVHVPRDLFPTLRPPFHAG